MKKILILFVAAIAAACSSGNNNFVINTPPEEIPTPVAVADNYVSVINTAYEISDLLDNDEKVEEVTLAVDQTSKNNGTIVKNNNTTYTYTPANNFVGEDSFDYTVCANADSEKCSSTTVTITVLDNSNEGIFDIPENLKSYYNSVTFSTNKDELTAELTSVTTNKHTTILYYSSRHTPLLKADQDPDNNTNVILMYTGESRAKSKRQTGGSSNGLFNTEHVYPQSLYAGGTGGDEKDEIVKGDLHHLRYCDSGVNSSRSNDKFVDGSGDAGPVGSAWYPGDEWKGDVARMIFYLNIRYGETITKVGNLDTFLEWNKEDPISPFEIQRNNVIEDAQGNRNPFIDNPYLATLIWGGEAAENKWD
ncbi:endonuclease [Ochrovirga pacifica]|uniref:endonuclease n=1 Tax=Ochrovirga pacifica TaxID=1042376 RepID=UPI00025594DE|nr:endonuclease [Ochrovirga pacifica]